MSNVLRIQMINCSQSWDSLERPEKLEVRQLISSQLKGEVVGIAVKAVELEREEFVEENESWTYTFLVHLT